MVVGRFDEHPPVDFAEPLDVEDVAPLEGDFLAAPFTIVHFLLGKFRHTGFPRGGDIADDARLLGIEFGGFRADARVGIFKLQHGSREIPPTVAVERKHQRLIASREPDLACGESLDGIIDQAVLHCFVHAPCHAQDDPTLFASTSSQLF